MSFRVILISCLLTWLPVKPVMGADGSALDICTSSLKQVKLAEAISICRKQLEVAYERNQPEQSTRIKLELASLYAQQGQSEDTRSLLGQIRTSKAFEQHRDIQYAWYRAMGADYLHKEQFQKALDYFKTAYDIAQQIKDIDKRARSANDLGLIFFKQDDFRQALLYYKESLELKETIGNKYYIGTTLNNLGLLNKDRKDYSQAIYYYEQALETYLQYTEQEQFDHRVFSNIYHLYEDLAVTYNLAGQAQKGHQYTQKVINTINKKLAANDKVRAFKNLAMIHIEQGDADGADNFIQQAKKYIQSNKYIAELDYIRASISYLRHQYSQANTLLEQAVPPAKNEDNNLLLENIYALKAKISQAQGNFKRAVEYLSKSFHYKELNLKKQYESDLEVIQQQIQKERIERQLVTEKLRTQQQRNQIQSLSNTVLIISLVLVFVAFVASFVIYRKVKERQRLLESIKSHKEKVLLLESESDQETEHNENSAKESGEDIDFRQLLVELLIETLALWEKTTQTDRIELAEKSGIWKVSIDDGRLRTRSLDKYIDINKIPQHPRWRNVVKTSHYVLAECTVNNEDRKALELKLDKVMQQVKARSMKKSP